MKQYTCTIVRTRENLYVQRDGASVEAKYMSNGNGCSVQNKQVFLQKHKKVIVLLAREAGTLGCGSTRLRGCHAANKNQQNKHTYMHSSN